MEFFGSLALARAVSWGEFYCPRCGTQEEYATRRVRRFTAVLGLPVIPGPLLGSYVECQRCQATYRPEVFDFDADAAEKRFLPEFQRTIKRLMAMMALRDGRVRPEELTVIASFYHHITGASLQPDELSTELGLAERDRVTVPDYLSTVAGLLNDEGKELVLKAVFLVSSSDGEFHAAELNFLREIGKSLRMSPPHVRRVIDSLIARGGRQARTSAPSSAGQRPRSV